jgi:hypothetical protein
LLGDLTHDNVLYHARYPCCSRWHLAGISSGARFQNALLGIWLILTVTAAALLAWEIVYIAGWFLR